MCLFKDVNYGIKFLVDSRDAELHVRTEMLESKAELEVSCAKLSTSIPPC